MIGEESRLAGETGERLPSLDDSAFEVMNTSVYLVTWNV